MTTPTVNLYTTTIPPFLRSLHALSNLLTKATEHATTQKIPLSYYLSHRLYPNMAALPFQIQRVSDSAKGVAVRVAGHEPVALEDNESTFEELQERIKRTVEILEKVQEREMVGREGREVVVKRSQGDWRMSADEYIRALAVPNFYFHVVTAYALLRSCGVPIEKLDYLGEA